MDDSEPLGTPQKPPQSGGSDCAEQEATRPGGSQFPDCSRWSEESVENGFRVGAVLGLTFSSLWKNPLLYFSLALLVCLPGTLIEWGYWMYPHKILLKQVLDPFFSVIFMGAIAYGVHRDMVGGRAGLGEAIIRGLSRYFSLIGISLLMLLIICFVCLGAVSFLGQPPIPVILYTLVGFCYVICVYSVAGPACVVEQLGPIGSMYRSAKLTKHYRWGVFGLLFVWGIGRFALTYAVNFVFFDGGMPGGMRFGLGPDFASLIITPITTAFYQVMLAVIYYLLRVTKEGVGLEKLATVFN